MATYSAQHARHECETHRLCAYLRKCRIHHAHGQAEHRDLGGDVSRCMPFKTSNGREQDCNDAEYQAMGITRFGLTEEVSEETTGDEGQDGYRGRQGGAEIVLPTPQASTCGVSAHDEALVPTGSNLKHKTGKRSGKMAEGNPGRKHRTGLGFVEVLGTQQENNTSNNLKQGSSVH